MKTDTCLFFIGIMHTGNDENLLGTLSSIIRQRDTFPGITSVIFCHINNIPKIYYEYGFTLITYTDKTDCFSKLAETLNNTHAEYQTLISSGEEFFAGAFDAVNKIFKTFEEVNWLTGIQTYQSRAGYNITLGNTSSRRWSYRVFESNLYKRSGRYIAPASTFWKKNLWLNASDKTHFIDQNNFIQDLWINFFAVDRLYTCKVYLSSCRNYDKIINLNFTKPNNSLLIEDSTIGRLKEFFFVNNIPYLRLFYRKSSGYIPVIRFDHNSQSYFLSDY